MKKLLIVEDTSIKFSAYIRLLEGQDLTIDCAESFEQAEYYLAHDAYDFIILDGKLAGKTHGRQVLAKISKEDYSKVIICSSDPYFNLEAKNYGITCFEKKAGSAVVLCNLIKSKL